MRQSDAALKLILPNESIALPSWSDWHPSPQAFSVGVEEEIMLLDPKDWSLTSAINQVMNSLPPQMAAWISAETQQSVLEIKTDPARSVTELFAQLKLRRQLLQSHLKKLGLRTASAGTHPFAEWRDVKVTEDRHHQSVYKTVG